MEKSQYNRTLALPILKYSIILYGIKIPKRHDFEGVVDGIFIILKQNINLNSLSENEVRVYVAHFVVALFSGYVKSLENNTTDGSFPVHPREWEYNDELAYASHSYFCKNNELGTSYLRYLKGNVSGMAEILNLDEGECKNYISTL